MKNLFLTILVAASMLLACNDDRSEEAVHASFSAVNQKSKAETTDTGEGTTKQFLRSADGKTFQLETGLVNLMPVELVPCATAFDFSFIGSAHAHGADEEAPGGVLDVSQADGTALELGELEALPGSYCGVKIALAGTPATAPAHGQVDMSGSSVYATACYYYQSPANTSTHYCFNLKLAPSAAVTVEFDEPVVLSAQDRHAAIHIAIAYDRWMDREAADDAFSALEGYDAIVANPPCVVADTTTYDEAACTAAKNTFKAGLQANEDLKELLTRNILASLSAEVVSE